MNILILHTGINRIVADWHRGFVSAGSFCGKKPVIPIVKTRAVENQLFPSSVRQLTFDNVITMRQQPGTLFFGKMGDFDRVFLLLT